MKISIIILTFNSCNQTTIPCLESIILNTSGFNYELIIVDNFSTDNTIEYLNNFKEKYNSLVRLILNKKNEGYAIGNNIGISASTGDYIVLLNNDTVVTPDWLNSLLNKFNYDPSIGLVGPVSNSVGNEQQIFNSNLNINNFHLHAKKYVDKRIDNFFYTLNLGFFCVAISRKVINSIGLLDINYGIGMFEDTDFCIRAINHGYKLVVAEDCFVFHSGSFSFNKLSNQKYSDIFKKNHSFFIQKNGFHWSISHIINNYWNKINLDLDKLKKELDSLDIEYPIALEDIEYRKNAFKSLLDISMNIESKINNVDYTDIIKK